MEGLSLYSRELVLEMVNLRDGETKIGENVQFCSELAKLSETTADFVLLGIPEDIGVRANYGIGGARSAWPAGLKALLNVQSNRYFQGSELLVLGHIAVDEPLDSSIFGLQEKVAAIDQLVFPVIEMIVAAGKIPIVVGGGHNNAYPIIKGCAQALQTAIDVINIDAHADLRPANGRHSGNGFSYALREKIMSKYGIFGLHQSYNNETMLSEIESDPRVLVIFLEEMLVNSTFKVQFWKELGDNFENPGLEIDLDSIEGMLSSAATPSGLSLNLVRELILTSAKKYTYLHVCEGATEMQDGRKSMHTAKAIAYLITDFIKNQKNSVSPK